MARNNGFDWALRQIKKGNRVCRKTWTKNGKFLFLAANLEFDTIADLSSMQHLQGHDFMHDCIMSKTSEDRFAAWVASQIDILAEDWITL